MFVPKRLNQGIRQDSFKASSQDDTGSSLFIVGSMTPDWISNVAALAGVNAPLGARTCAA
ncbi:MAG: hypothetical protein AAGF92_14465 [Myxococcota bacterium]